MRDLQYCDKCDHYYKTHCKCASKPETKPTPADDPSGQTLAGAGGDAVLRAAFAQIIALVPAQKREHARWIADQLTATSAGTTGDALPELPEPEGEMRWTRSAGVCIRPEPGYDADQMREYARRARGEG